MKDNMQADGYSKNLQCRNCKFCLEPIAGISRATNIFCEKYTNMENPKPSSVLWGNGVCKHYSRGVVAGDSAIEEIEDGGPGSGNFGHAGRKGKRGGSAKRGAGGGGAETIQRQQKAAAKSGNALKFKQSFERALKRLPEGAHIKDSDGSVFRKNKDGTFTCLQEGETNVPYGAEELADLPKFDDENMYFRIATPEDIEKAKKESGKQEEETPKAPEAPVSPETPYSNGKWAEAFNSGKNERALKYLKGAAGAIEGQGGQYTESGIQEAESAAFDRAGTNSSALMRLGLYMAAKSQFADYAEKAKEGDFDPYNQLSREEQDTLYEYADMIKDSMFIGGGVKSPNPADVIGESVDWLEPDESLEFLRLVNKAMGGKVDSATKRTPEQEKELKRAALNTERDNYLKRASSAMRAIDSAESIEQVAEGMRQMEVFSNGDHIDVSSVSVSTAKATARAIDRVVRRYPGLIGFFSSIDGEESGSNTYASCSRDMGALHYGIIMRKNENVDSSYYSDCLKGFHPGGTVPPGGAEAIMTHEIGHALDGYISKKVTQKFGKYASDYLIDKVMSRARNQYKDEKSMSMSVSEYAAKNRAEFFAECFTQGMLSPSPTGVSRVFMEELDKFMHEHAV